MTQDTFLTQMNTALMTVLIVSAPALAAAILSASASACCRR